MTSQRSRGRLSFFFIAIGVAAVAASLRRFSLHREAVKAFGSKIPRGAMAIRRESLVDLTTDGRPVRQTVFIAEAAGEVEIVAGEVEELSPLEASELPEPDPGESNPSGTITDVAPSDSLLGGEESILDAEELHAEAAAVLAEADRIEEEASEADLLSELPVEELIGRAHDDEDAAIESVTADDLALDIPAAAAIEPIEDEIADAELAEEDEIADAELAGDDEAGELTEPEEAEPEEAAEEEAEEDFRVTSKDGACPESHPIKVRFATGRYHEPGTPTYDHVVADACYASVKAAETDGFSASPL